MKRFDSALIVHNPTAGNGNTSREYLLEDLNSYAKMISYISVKEKNWTKILKEKYFDGIFLAGGDGTVHKILNAFIELSLSKPIIYLIPTGTANNIYKTLQNKLGESYLNPKNITGFNAGFLEENNRLCYESIGFGVFPQLLSLMEQKKYDDIQKQEKLKRVFQNFIEIVENFDGVKLRMEINDTIIEDIFLLVEFTNLVSIGPNLEIAPKASPFDNFFYLVMIPRKKKNEFLKYLQSGAKLSDFATFIKAEKVKITSRVPLYHIDDILRENSGTLTVNIKTTGIKLLPFPKIKFL